MIKVIVKIVSYHLGIMLLILGILNAYASEVEKTLEFTEAVPLERMPPKYPRKELDNSNSGLVEILFMVDTSGNTYEPIAVRSTKKSFEASAIRAVKKYKFTPATLNGNVVNSVQSIRIAFEMYNNKDAVTPSFANIYNSALKSLDEDHADKEIIQKKITNMERRNFLSPYAYAYINLVKVLYANKFGSDEEKIHAIEQMLLFEGRVGSKGKFIDDKQNTRQLQKLVNLYLNHKLYGEALNALDRLIKLDSSSIESYQRAINKVSEINTNDQAFAVELKLSDRGYVSRNLFKNNFSFNDIDGQINTLKLRCRNKFAELAFNQEAEYKIPKSWGNCHIQIIGDVGTTAQLVQF